MTRVAFLSCHLSGTGHLARTLALARAVAETGAAVRVLSGGRPLAHLDSSGVALVQLPPLAVRDLDFTTLCDGTGEVAGPDHMAARQEAIAGALRAFRPHALVTELFPLGRRRLADEFLAAIRLVRALEPRAAVIASVRDVPEPPRKPARIAEAADRLAAHYDALLVHGEAGFLPLAASWPLPERVAPLVRHTGYVGPPPAVPDGPPDETVLVAGGGGALGDRLAGTAAAAAALGGRRWHVLTGGPEAAATAAWLTARHPGAPLTVEPVRADYRARLARAGVSVSLAGYNTVMDLAACDTPALLVPFEGAGEREQAIRARALAGLPGVMVLDGAALSPEGLAAAAARAAAGPRRPPFPLALDGAARAAEAIRAVCAQRAAA